MFLSYPSSGQSEESLKDNAEKYEAVSGKKASLNDARKCRAKSNIDTNDSSDRKGSFVNLTVCGVTVECSVCGVKLGRFSVVECPCSCGIMVPGPALRINAVKVGPLAV